jgi:predicted nucleotidyltransferase
MVRDKWIERFKQEILPGITKEYKVKRILLFGSRIKGTQTTNSDIDVIIISDSFRDIPFISRMSHVLKRFRFTKHVDYLCYTPEEFERIKEKSSLLIDALEHAETIVS